jgi:very-short-patch-repair endonuclease
MKNKKQHFSEFYYNTTAAKYLRKTETKAEKLLWARLRNRQVDGLKFRRQHPIGYFITDFYCHEIKLIKELEGKIHNKKEQKEYDKLRKELINSWEYNISTFKNEQIYNDIEKVILTIKKIAKKLKFPSPHRRGEKG